ncbi:MAG TPA: RtcB family protein [Gemmatimonadaceae bacterium]|nr:RtcB family protein [Gemmatimonadaceae bacterium]
MTTAAVAMVHREDLVQVGSCAFELPTSWRSDMRVAARVYADEMLLEAMLSGEAMTQLVNVATLPGVVGCLYGMPDMHEGYGFPVGGVAATRMPDGVVSPGGVGFDINCGVRLLTTPLTRERLGQRHEPLVHEMSRSIPSGTGRGGRWSLTDDELDRVLADGSAWLVRERALGLEADVAHTESGGCLAGADPAKISRRARDRGRDQLGTLGAGNHFIELQVVDRILDRRAAEAYGLSDGAVTVLIHTGSRGLGHQVCTDFVRLMDERMASHGITLPDRQLSCAPASSPEGRDYLAAMAAAANFAWSNRQLITHRVRQKILRLCPEVRAEDVRVTYDVAHNIAKLEEHAGESLCVHRKGATRAFGPGHPELPSAYAAAGQPVFIPGSMGTASFVMAGASTSEARSFGSACHGAGRALSRTAAKKQVTGAELRKLLEAQGVVVRCPSNKGLAEEAPVAYKDVERVAEVVELAGLATRVARLRPIGVIIGIAVAWRHCRARWRSSRPCRRPADDPGAQVRDAPRSNRRSWPGARHVRSGGIESLDGGTELARQLRHRRAGAIRRRAVHHRDAGPRTSPRRTCRSGHGQAPPASRALPDGSGGSRAHPRSSRRCRCGARRTRAALRRLSDADAAPAALSGPRGRLDPFDRRARTPRSCAQATPTMNHPRCVASFAPSAISRSAAMPRRHRRTRRRTMRRSSAPSAHFRTVTASSRMASLVPRRSRRCASRCLDASSRSP